MAKLHAQITQPQFLFQGLYAGASGLLTLASNVFATSLIAYKAWYVPDLLLVLKI